VKWNRKGKVREKASGKTFGRMERTGSLEKKEKARETLLIKTDVEEN
jgi:hypothetical protein